MHRIKRLILLSAACIIICFLSVRSKFQSIDIPAPKQKPVGRVRCQPYQEYSQFPHNPRSQGPLRLPFQRPLPKCRTFHSDAIEQVILDMRSEIKNDDLFRLFENCFPNTLDTTIKFHDSEKNLTFVVTGDIDAEWLRDSHRQLSPYIRFANRDPALSTLISGAIRTQASYVSQFPMCNAFHPPPESKIPVKKNNQRDAVWPPVDLKVVYECKQELDSLASFFGLANEYYKATGDTSFMDEDWIYATKTALRSVERLQSGTFSSSGLLNSPVYTFKRMASSGTETQNNNGLGNAASYTGMVRSFFRPSDDATIMQFLVPANAQMAVELERVAKYLPEKLAKHAFSLSQKIGNAVKEHAIINHKDGQVYAYEVDGYGGAVIMDDANIPSLLSLPDLGFVAMDDPVYLNTRKLVLSSANPYYSKGFIFKGIGGPHIGFRNAWPMSLMVAIRTSTNVTEIVSLLDAVMRSTSSLGLMHESVHVDTGQFTRSWFAWANSEFAKTILDLKDRKLLGIVQDEMAKFGHN